MLALPSVKSLEKMNPATAASPQPHSLSRQSSDVDYAIAEQLIQHSQRARHNSELDAQDSGRGRFENSDDPEHPKSTTSNGLGKVIRNPHQERQSSLQPTSQENLHSDGQYDPMANSLTLGQICRLVILRLTLCPEHRSQ